MKLKLSALFTLAIFLITSIAYNTTSANAALRVPKSAFKACSEGTSIYCVEEVTITAPNGKKIPLVYVPAGQDVPAAQATASAFMPLGKIVGGVIAANDWWVDKWQMDLYTNPNLKAIDISNLWGTPTYPEFGAYLDPVTNTFDINVPMEGWTQDWKCYSNGQWTITTRGSCKSGSVALLIDHKVISIWNGPDAAWAAKLIATDFGKSTTYVNLTDLANQKLQPTRGTTYNLTTKTFAKTESLVIPSWLATEALKNGWTLPGETTATVATGTSKDAASANASPIDTQTSTPAVIEVGRTLPGRWTTANWQANGLNALGYDGIYIEAKAANEFVNHLFIDVLPTVTGGDKKVNLASQVGSGGYAANLDPDIVLSVKVRSGDIRPGVIMASAIDVETDTQYYGSYSAITITGSPVTVPLAKSIKDCTGEDGVAKANVRQFQATVLVQNDTAGFGVEGTSGDMYVGTNGICEAQSPVWSEENKTFTWVASAPHFSFDGKTVNKGFYKAVIPSADAKLLWGMSNTNDAATALTVSVVTETGGSAAAISVIAVKNGKIIIDVSNFSYSRPKLTISLKKGYKSVAIKKTIMCTKGSLSKKVTSIKPICPKGYVKK